MPDIELAIAKSAFTVFPGFAPHDAGETDQQPGRLDRGRAQGTALERVVLRVVVMQAVGNAGQSGAQDIGFKWMQVAGRGIAAQRPAIRPITLPGREPEGKFQQRGETGEIRRNWNFGRISELTVTAFVALCGERETQERRPCVMAKRRRLGIPVKLAGSFSVGVKTMAGARVVGTNHFL